MLLDVKMTCHWTLRYDMMRIRLDLQTISTTALQSAQERNAMQDELQTDLVRHHDSLTDSLDSVYQQVDQRIGHIEEHLKAQSDQLRASQLHQLGPFYGHSPSYTRPKPRPTPRRAQHEKMEHPNSVSVRVSQYSACRPGCPCACHSQIKSATPGLADRVMGQLFVGYTGLPLISRKCDTEICRKSQTPSVSLEYWFPLGFVWSQIFRLQMTYQSNVGPQFELQSLRRVPDSAQCVNFALNGNVDGLKDLFIRGLASPRDVSSTRGYSILRVRDIARFVP